MITSGTPGTIVSGAPALASTPVPEPTKTTEAPGPVPAMAAPDIPKQPRLGYPLNALRSLNQVPRLHLGKLLPQLSLLWHLSPSPFRMPMLQFPPQHPQMAMKSPPKRKKQQKRKRNLKICSLISLQKQNGKLWKNSECVLSSLSECPSDLLIIPTWTRQRSQQHSLMRTRIVKPQNPRLSCCGESLLIRTEPKTPKLALYWWNFFEQGIYPILVLLFISDSPSWT